jgi:hypothetical protein
MLDLVLSGLWFDGNLSSDFGTGIDASGNSVVASVEAGYPIPFSSYFSLEPQAQFIWQHLSLDDKRDAISSIGFETPDGIHGQTGPANARFGTDREGPLASISKAQSLV